MKKRRKRQDKKLHKKWLDYGVIDASTESFWRKKLFAADDHEPFPIDAVHHQGLAKDVVEALHRYELQYLVAKVPAEASTADPDEDFVIFKFWARRHPSVQALTFNNPLVV